MARKKDILAEPRCIMWLTKERMEQRLNRKLYTINLISKSIAFLTLITYFFTLNVIVQEQLQKEIQEGYSENEAC